jgi:hypothetical protein
MVAVFDCLSEFSEPAAWMRNTRQYLRPRERLVIVDPDPSKLRSSHFQPRTTIHECARQSGCTVVAVDDWFLKSHMIVVLEPRPGQKSGEQ